MAIETTAAGTIITGEDVNTFRILAIRSALKIEIETGMKMHRGAQPLRAANQTMGTNFRRKRDAYNELNARIVSAGGQDKPLKS